MKLAKIMVPLAVLPLIGMLLAMYFNDYTPLIDYEELPPELAFLVIFELLFTLLLHGAAVLPMMLFIPFGVAILICALCIFVAKGKFASVTAALVLTCVLSPVVIYLLLYSLIVLIDYMFITSLVIAICAAHYIAALVMIFIAYFKAKAERAKPGLQTAIA